MVATTTSTVATLHGLSPGDAPALRCQLVVVEGPDRGRGAAITAEPLLVGSDPRCGLVLSDERVSGRHLEIHHTAAAFRVRDLGSRNGTLYAGSTVGQAQVPAGATLKVGRTFLRVVPQPEALEVNPSQARRLGDLVGESLEMREIFAVLELAAGSDVTVLLEGETGTGKELAARAVHEAGARRRKPFVAVDCGALPEQLLESELFGHVRGAFTGAAGPRKGAFVRAEGGTLFLDELDSISPSVQARLLRVLEQRVVLPVGADRERPVDIRVVAASRADLGARVAEGTFRPDLYYRVSVLRLVLPPLRRRREDIGPIVAELLRLRGFEDLTVDGPDLQRLATHHWPGNVRELRNVVDRAVALNPAARCFADLRPGVPGMGPGVSVGPLSVRTDLTFAEAKSCLLQTFEARYLGDLLDRCAGNISAAAREANLDRKHLRTLLRRHGLVS